MSSEDYIVAANGLLRQAISLTFQVRDLLTEAERPRESGEMTACLCILRDVHAVLNARERDAARAAQGPPP